MQHLERLAAGDPETWNEAFRCLYPVAFEAARSRLGEVLADECEDVALESLSEMLEKSAQVKSEGELKPLVAAIARNKATDRMRRHLTDKRGGNKLQSLDAMLASNEGECAEIPHEPFLDSITLRELQGLLADLSVEVKKEYRVVLRDHFFDHLSYNEIAEKRKISVGSVGVYLQRGLASLRNVIARTPRLQREFLAMFSDASVVRVLLPLASALQLGGWFFDYTIRYQRAEINDSRLSDEDRLRMVCEFTEVRTLGETQRSYLVEKLKLKHPLQYQLWQQKQEDNRRNDEEMRLRWKAEEKRNRVIGLFVLVGLAVGLVYALIRLAR